MRTVYVLRGNPPRTRKKKTKRKTSKRRTKKKPTRSRKKTTRRRTTKKKVRSRTMARRKKKTRRKAAPKRRKKRTTSRKRKTTARRRRRKTSTRRKTTARRRRRRRNPGGLRRRRVTARRRRRRRSNPGLLGRLKRLASKDSLMTAGTGTVGFALALALPRLALQAAGKSHLNRGWYGVGASAVATAVASAAVGAVGSQKAARTVFIGGLIATAIRAALQVIPRGTADKVIPLRDLGAASSLPARTAASSAPSLNGFFPGGQAARPALPMNGMGAFFNPSQLGPSYAFAPAGHGGERF